MDKFYYDSLMSKIKLLEIKIDRLYLEKNYLYIIKPTFFEMRKKRAWCKRLNELLKDEKETINLLEINRIKLGNIF